MNNNDTITVLLVDDHPMVQDGLSSCLSYYDDISIIGASQTGEDAIKEAKNLQPDVVLMDISMPGMNGIDATELLCEQLPATKVLIFSMHDSIEFVTNAVQAGASGYILKDTTSEEVYYAIKAVHSGKTHFSSSIAKVLIETPTPVEGIKLTTREQVVLAYIAKGYSSKEVARQLSISVRTVEAHRRNIKTKLKIDSLAELIHYAISHALIENPAD
ncbi:response regulator transcription factor [Gammaproteobacteria bacterium AS21]